jgi:hypothetical protein
MVTNAMFSRCDAVGRILIFLVKFGTVTLIYYYNKLSIVLVQLKGTPVLISQLKVKFQSPLQNEM